MTQQLLLTRGDDRTLTLTVPSPADLSTATSLRFTAKASYTDTSTVFAKTLTSGITVNSARVATVDIDDSDWTDVHYSDPLVADVEVIDAAGDVTTLWQGTIKVQDDVSR